ncbi:hypothetical protein BS50DRAFT_334 [Corynespora cassiicola Philippines]|uniref:Uncharacterized protein n=1 Tax=Corynespora cassiicola Philippines TaxID=1448308 RepID=A0A2T2P8C9_CORCC|nr:hypothetical protein BS50DRAFT_334 [Corynespora cassiicola Philippines]
MVRVDFHSMAHTLWAIYESSRRLVVIFFGTYHLHSAKISHQQLTAIPLPFPKVYTYCSIYFSSALRQNLAMDNPGSANPHHMVFQAFRQDVVDAGWPSLLKHIPTYNPRPVMNKEGSKHGINSVTLFNRAHIFVGIHQRSRYEPISHVYALVESERAKVYFLRPSSELNSKPWLKVPAEDRLVHAGAMWSLSWEKVELLPQFEQLEAHKQNPENLRGALLALLQYYLLQWVSRPNHGDSKKYRTPAIHELVSAAKSLAVHKGIVLERIPRAPAYDGYSRQLSEIRRQMGASETKKRKRNDDDTSAYAARAPTATADSELLRVNLGILPLVKASLLNIIFQSRLYANRHHEDGRDRHSGVSASTRICTRTRSLPSAEPLPTLFPHLLLPRPRRAPSARRRASRPGQAPTRRRCSARHGNQRGSAPQIAGHVSVHDAKSAGELAGGAAVAGGGCGGAKKGGRGPTGVEREDVERFGGDGEADGGEGGCG